MPQDTAGWIALLFALALGYAVGRAAGRNAERRDALAGAAAPPPPPSPELLAQVRAALAAGETIAAIRLLREGTGMELKAAKQAVERLKREG